MLTLVAGVHWLTAPMPLVCCAQSFDPAATLKDKLATTQRFVCLGVLCACASALTLPGLRCTATTKGLGTFSVQNSRRHHRLPCMPESCCAPSVTHPSLRSVASGVASVALPHTWPHPRVAGCVEQLILVCCSKRFMPQCQVAETIMADLLVRPNMWRALHLYYAGSAVHHTSDVTCALACDRTSGDVAECNRSSRTHGPAQALGHAQVPAAEAVVARAPAAVGLCCPPQARTSLAVVGRRLGLVVALAASRRPRDRSMRSCRFRIVCWWRTARAVTTWRSGIDSVCTHCSLASTPTSWCWRQRH